jgi:formylglycine-generating enzyme
MFEKARKNGPVCWITVFIMMLGITVVSCRTEEIPVARDGEALAVIVHNGYEEHAAILQEYLKRMTGAEIPVTEKSSAEHKGRSLLVLEVVDKISGTSDRFTGWQAYRILAKDGRLSLAARSEVGLFYAVYGFLDDHLGMRFFAPDAEVVPERANLSLSRIDDTREPVFSSRWMSPWRQSGHKGREWYTKNRGGGSPLILSHHTFYKWIPPGEYLKEHPEWFVLQDGERVSTYFQGLCGTNKELAEEMAKRLMERMAEPEETGWWRLRQGEPLIVGQGDGFTGCECGECRRLVKEEESEAAPIILMLNRAAEITARTYPNQMIATFAYFGTLKPPKNLRPHSNVGINIVSSDLYLNSAGDQMGPIRGNPANMDYREAIRGWPSIAGPEMVGIWNWEFGNRMFEVPNIFNMCDNIRFWRECGVGSVFIETSRNIVWEKQGAKPGSWDWLRRWVYFRMMWNPENDPEKLVREFLEGYYGTKAAPHLWNYLKYVSDAGKNQRPWSITRWTGSAEFLQQTVFTDERLSRMEQFISSAEDAAARENNPVFAERVSQVRPTTVDLYRMFSAGEPKRVTDLRNGSEWFVPGGRKEMPASVERVYGQCSWGVEPVWLAKHNNQRLFGGRMFLFENEQLVGGVVPNMDGRVVSLVHKPSGREILGKRAPTGLTMSPHLAFRRGYGDTVTGAVASFVKEDDVEENDSRGVRIRSDLQFYKWVQNPPYTYVLERAVELDGDRGRLSVKRLYSQSGAKLRNRSQHIRTPLRTAAEWTLKIADPSTASVKISGGGIDISRSTAGIPQGETVKADVTRSEGSLVVEVDRGDGLSVVLTARAEDCASVTLTFESIVMLKESVVTVSFADRPADVSPEEKLQIVLPSHTLEVKVSNKGVLAVSEPSMDCFFGPVRPLSLSESEKNRAVNRRDDAQLVWIPAGDFKRGSPESEGWSDESPAGKVYLDGYWITKRPVTVAQYRRFARETGRRMPEVKRGWQYRPSGPEDSLEDLPVLVNWYDAMAYARWAGGTLPTDAQWEKAARGTDGRRYPWGSEWEPSKAVGWFEPSMRYDVTLAGVPPVNFAEDVSPYGVEAMAGNVWEWVADWYSYDMNREKTSREEIPAFRADLAHQGEVDREIPVRNPTGPENGILKVLRGGDAIWDHRFVRCAARMPHPPHVENWVRTGFRYVIDGKRISD